MSVPWRATPSVDERVLSLPLYVFSGFLAGMMTASVVLTALFWWLTL